MERTGDEEYAKCQFARDMQATAGSVAPVLVLVLLANSIPLLVAWHFDLGRPWVNTDYLLLAAVVMTRFRWFGVLLLPVAFMVDMLTLVSQMFPVSRLTDVIYLLRFALSSSGYYQALLLSALAATGTLTFLFWYVGPSESRFKVALIFLNLGLLAYVAEVYTEGPGENLNRLWRMKYEPWAYSQLVSYYDQSNTGFWQTLSSEGEPFSTARPASMSHDWVERDPQELNDRILLIVSESWGMPRNPDIQRALIKPIEALGPRIEWLQSGGLNFLGATIAGELRELCQLFPNHFNMANVTEEFESCLPNRLAEAGYRTHAMHGAAGIMYDRVRWYPRVGFESMTFFESQNWSSRCYSFPGACDIELLGEVEKVFAEPGKQFFYWLTLNSHSFYDERDIRFDVFDCSDFRVQLDSETCRNFRLHAQFFHKLAETLAKPSMSGVEVLIVGDHAPPIFQQAEKAKHFVKDEVAWLHFKLR